MTQGKDAPKAKPLELKKKTVAQFKVSTGVRAGAVGPTGPAGPRPN